MIKANYISTSEFVEYNPDLDFSSYTDATISGMITRASARVDNYLQYSLSVESIVNELNSGLVSPDGNLIIYTKKIPIISIEQVQIRLGTVFTNLSLIDGNGSIRYNINNNGTYAMMPYQQLATTGTIVMRNFFDLRGRDVFINTNYTAGYSEIPDDIKDAVNLYAKDIFIRQANPMNIISGQQGGMNVQYKSRSGNSDGSKDSYYSDLVQQAMDILSSYKRRIAP